MKKRNKTKIMKDKTYTRASWIWGFRYIILTLFIVGLGIIIQYTHFLSLSPTPLHSSPTTTSNYQSPPVVPQKTYQKEEKPCLCELRGAIEDCLCQIDTIDEFNNYKIYPRMQSLLSKDYFRYFQVNLKRVCPYWVDDSQCAFEFCQVKECRDDEIPIGLKGQQNSHKLQQPKNKNKNDCETDNELGTINTTISEESQEGFSRWEVYDKSLADFCSIQEDEVDTDLQYVDLLLNPEKFTGYGGPSAHRIWKSIYQENCFKPSSSQNLVEPFHSQNQDESCIEKRTFYRAISGLHSSINIHLSSKYLLSENRNVPFLRTKEKMIWGPNLTEFLSHFDSNEGSKWLKNLYFVYLLELKALSKLSPYLRQFNFYTGNSDEDSDVGKAVKDLTEVITEFPSHFQEDTLFSRNDASKLKLEFHKRFTNITRIMDCVGCEKCKLWGKIQIKGLGTALKVLFSEPFRQKKIGNVSRTEIVALINSFGRLSESIYEVDNFKKMIKSNKSHTHTITNGKTEIFNSL